MDDLLTAWEELRRNAALPGLRGGRRLDEQGRMDTRQAALLIEMTTRFNAAMYGEEVIQALTDTLQALSFNYLSVYRAQGERLVWDLPASLLPDWLAPGIRRVAERWLRQPNLEIWADLEGDNPYACCYRSGECMALHDAGEVLSPLHLGDHAYASLPAWVKKAGQRLVDRLGIAEHLLFRLGCYGLVFLSAEGRPNGQSHKDWVCLIIQQAGVAMDRLLAFDALRKSDIVYRALFDRTNDAVFIIGLDKTHLAVNEQASRMLGYSVQELVGMPISRVVLPDEFPNSIEREKQLLSGEIPPIYRRTFVRKDGSHVIAEVSVALVKDADGKPLHIQSIARDITERIQVEQRINYLATHDPLTGLPNRYLLLEQLVQIIAAARRKKNKAAVLFIDLDGFKQVNDTYGHEVGDALLVATAERLRLTLRESDLIARLGGDEFALVLPDLEQESAAGHVAQKVTLSLEQPFTVVKASTQQALELCISASVGAAVYPEHGADPSELLQAADNRMYAIKRGKGR